MERNMTMLKVFQTLIEREIFTVKNELTFIREDVKDLKGSHRSQIWVLIVAVVGAIVKFGFSLILSSAIAVTIFDSQMIIKREMLTSSSPLRYSSDDQKPTRDRLYSQFVLRVSEGA